MLKVKVRGLTLGGTHYVNIWLPGVRGIEFNSDICRIWMVLSVATNFLVTSLVQRAWSDVWAPHSFSCRVGSLLGWEEIETFIIPIGTSPVSLSSDLRAQAGILTRHGRVNRSCSGMMAEFSSFSLWPPVFVHAGSRLSLTHRHGVSVRAVRDEPSVMS